MKNRFTKELNVETVLMQDNQFHIFISYFLSSNSVNYISLYIAINLKNHIRTVGNFFLFYIDPTNPIYLHIGSVTFVSNVLHA